MESQYPLQLAGGTAASPQGTTGNVTGSTQKEGNRDLSAGNSAENNAGAGNGKDDNTGEGNVNDDGAGDGNSQDGQEEEGAPRLTIRLIDQKHADVIVDCKTIAGGSFDNVYHFELFMPDNMRLDWSKDFVYYYHPDLGGFGKVETSVNGDGFLFHISMEADPKANYSEKWPRSSITVLRICRTRPAHAISSIQQ